MNKTHPFSWHIFPLFFAVVLGVFILFYKLSTAEIKSFYEDLTQQELLRRAEAIALTLRDDNGDITVENSTIKELGAVTETRITLITPSGRVIAESQLSPENIANHADRPEVKEAIAHGKGKDIRFSQTIREPHMYVAILNNDLIIRTSVPLKQIDTVLINHRRNLTRSIGITILIAALATLLISWYITKPLKELQYHAKKLSQGVFTGPLLNSSVTEIAELSSIMKESSRLLTDRFHQLRTQKERLRSTLSSMIEGVIAFDQDERVFLINDAARSILSINCENPIGKELTTLFRCQSFRGLVELLQKEGEDFSRSIEIMKDDEIRYIRSNCRILEQNRGFLVVLHDITDIKRLENLRRDFASNVSHELRTPLTSIKGFVETILYGAIDSQEDTKHFLEIINTQVNRLNQLIEDLLTIAQLEREEDRGIPQLENHPILPIIENILHIYSPQAKEKESEIIFEKSIDEISLPMKPALIEQALGNLVENAIKYGGTKSRITISADCSSDSLNISVSDTGPGIEPEHLPRLFERFYRTDKARSSSLGGTGLGLSIVKHIAIVHRGSVDVKSKKGSGTTFTLTLPKK